MSSARADPRSWPSGRLWHRLSGRQERPEEGRWPLTAAFTCPDLDQGFHGHPERLNGLIRQLARRWCLRVVGVGCMAQLVIVVIDHNEIVDQLENPPRRDAVITDRAASLKGNRVSCN
jgi:hypothetical protein